MSKRSLIQLSFCLLLLATALSRPPLAEANCYYPTSYIVNYYAWIDNANPNWYSCNYIIISPPWQAHWGLIGQVTVDCDSMSTWGDTTSCTGSGNTEFLNGGFCNAICD